MNTYFELGTYSRPITTVSPETQRWFDRGLIWCYGFNHEEAIRCFQRAIEYDATCAMAYWGLAYATGPFYNKPWEFFGEQERVQAVTISYETVQKALAYRHGTTAVEQALIQALTQRYQAGQANSIETLHSWDAAYATAMQSVYATFPHDLDVMALYAEALMTKTPWKLWNVHTGQPANGADTVEAVGVLEAGLDLIDQQGGNTHAGVAHMYIHAIEMSPYPERALRAADALRELVPDSGHLCHMPSHIDVLCGDYYNALAVSRKAIDADAKYLAQVGPYSFYTTACCHDYHLMMYAAMFLGQYKPALEAANGIVNLLSEDVLRVDTPHLASTLEGYYSMKMHVLVRFGRWADILAEPLPSDPQLYCVTTAMFHYAKGVAQAATGHIAEAEAEQEKFKKALTRIPTTRRFFNNSALDVLAVGGEMLKGELEYRKGNYTEAFAHLRQAIALDDNLFYTEPWAWMHPPRHALGALLLEQNQVAEAEQIYRADLGLDPTLSRPSQHPNNVWSLHGYVECLTRQKKQTEAEAIRLPLDLALARTDMEIRASCCCRGGAGCCA